MLGLEVCCWYAVLPGAIRPLCLCNEQQWRVGTICRRQTWPTNLSIYSTVHMRVCTSAAEHPEVASESRCGAALTGVWRYGLQCQCVLQCQTFDQGNVLIPVHEMRRAERVSRNTRESLL